MNEQAKIINSADLAFHSAGKASKEVMPLLRRTSKCWIPPRPSAPTRPQDYTASELKKAKKKIKNSYRCGSPRALYASSFISIARPLVELGNLARLNYPFKLPPAFRATPANREGDKPVRRRPSGSQQTGCAQKLQS